MPFGVDERVWNAFLAGIARGTYHLLLGAGASADGRDYFDTPLPVGSSLAKDLVREFTIPSNGDIGLPRAYDAAKRRRRRNEPTDVDGYLAERFTGCAAPPWFSQLVEVRWRRIWTLNIDDTLDDAYLEAGNSAAQAIRPTHWNQPFFEEESPDRAAVVHLHGRARSLTGHGDENLVFGLEQYLEAGRERYAWHHVFGDLFGSQPFLVIGASLSEEYDLAAILRRGNASAEALGLPSLAVLQAIDPLRREELESAGLVPVEAGGKEFFDALAKELPDHVAAIPAPHLADGQLPSQALKFLSQWRPLSPDEEPERDERHDLYAGHEPTWQDIVRNRDAVFQVAERAADVVTEALADRTEQRIICISGPRFTGKTTALYRTARTLISAAYDVYLFIGDERPDITVVRWWVEKAGRPTVLLFDGLADYIPDLRDLLRRGGIDENRICVLGTEREGRVRRLLTSLAEERLAIGGRLELGQLSDADINSLIMRLREAGRLGRITGRNRGGQITYFRTESRRSLFSAMARLEHAEGFTDRLRHQYDALGADSPLQRAYGACSLVHALGYRTPLPLLLRVSELTVKELIRAKQQNVDFAELVSLERDSVRARQRTLASLVAEEVLTSGDRYDLAAAIAEGLAPHISPATIRQRTIYARIASEIMDERILRDWIGLDQVERWYEQQAGLHGWNARFWEQRALAASARSLWDRAESYAEKAVDIREDPFTLNTLGVILLRKAAETTRAGTEHRWGFYWRGVRALEQSRERGNEEFMHPHVTFFEYTIRLAHDELTSGGAIPPQVLRTWQDWLLRARWSPAFAHPEMARQIEEFHARWLGFAVAKETRGTAAADS